MTVDSSRFHDSPSRHTPTPSPAYRLVLAMRGPYKEHREALLGYLPRFLSTVAERRTFAKAALQHGDVTSLRKLPGLSEWEKAWLLLWVAHNLGDDDAVMGNLSRLPTTGYPDKVGIIAAHWPAACTEPHRQVVRDHLGPFDTDPLAASLLCSLGERRWRDVQAAFATGRWVAPGVALDDQQVALWRQWMGSSEEATLNVTSSNPLECIAYALRHGTWPATAPIMSKDFDAGCSDWVSRVVKVAASAGLSVLDDLIDRDLLGREAAAVALDAPDGNTNYVRARLAPESLSDEELVELDHQAELNRRSFVSGGAPDGSDRLLSLLNALRTGDRSVVAELITLVPEHHRTVVLALGRSLRDGTVDVDALVDRSTWPLLSSLLPPAETLAEAHPGLRRLSEWVSLRQAQERLYESEWEAAAQAARTCLRTAEDESTRDEALNFLAAALYQLGNVDGARRALEDALDGVDSVDLIINYGIVAGEHDKHAASSELARLAVEAPTLALRLTAARRALALWNDHVPGAGEPDDPPTSLISAMRGLSVEPTGLDEHAQIMRFLSWADQEWLADERHTRGSPYADSPQHRYLVARAQGFEQAQLSLGELSALHPDDEWLAAERASMAESWIQLMLTSEESLPGLGMCALNFVDSGLDVDVRQRVLLNVLGTRELLIYMIKDDEARSPKMDLLDRLLAARTLVAGAPDLDDDAFSGLIDDAIHRFALASWRGWATAHDTVVDAYNSMLGQLTMIPRHRVNRDAVRRTTAPMVRGLDEIEVDINTVLRLRLPGDTSASLQKLLGGIRELRQALVRLGS